MSDEMREALEAYLTSLLESAEQGAAWTAEQVPLVIQEKLAFDFWWNVLWLAACPVLAFTTFRLAARSLRKVDNSGDNDGWLFVGFVSGVAFFISVPLFFVATHDALQITLAPRLYIVEWIRGLL